MTALPLAPAPIALRQLADLLDVPDERFAATIAPALELAFRWSGWDKKDFYTAIREALLPDAQIPITDLLQVLGRDRVVPTLRERFS